MAHSVLLPTCFVGSPGSSPSYKIFEKNEQTTNNKQQKSAKREKQWQLA